MTDIINKKVKHKKYVKITAIIILTVLLLLVVTVGIFCSLSVKYKEESRYTYALRSGGMTTEQINELMSYIDANADNIMATLGFDAAISDILPSLLTTFIDTKPILSSNLGDSIYYYFHPTTNMFVKVSSLSGIKVTKKIENLFKKRPLYSANNISSETNGFDYSSISKTQWRSLVKGLYASTDILYSGDLSKSIKTFQKLFSKDSVKPTIKTTISAVNFFGKAIDALEEIPLLLSISADILGEKAPKLLENLSLCPSVINVIGNVASSSTIVTLSDVIGEMPNQTKTFSAFCRYLRENTLYMELQNVVDSELSAFLTAIDSANSTKYPKGYFTESINFCSTVTGETDIASAEYIKAHDIFASFSDILDQILANMS